MVDGRIVNDSYIIMRNLGPALYGSAFDDDLEKRITYGVQLAFEVEAMEEPSSVKPFLAAEGMPSCMATCCGCLLPIGAPGKSFPKGMRRKRAAKDAEFGPLRGCVEYLREFKETLGSREFFGGSEPGPLDVSLWATLCTWPQVPITDVVFEESGLAAWRSAVERAMPLDKLMADKWESP